MDPIQSEPMECSTPNVMVRFREAELDDAGQRLLVAARMQNAHLNTILAPSDGVVFAVLSDAEAWDDVVEIVVRDLLTWRERTTMFGVDGLDREHWSGQRGPDGDPIPTEEWMDSVELAYGGSLPTTRRFTIPARIVCAVQRGEMTGAQAWNAAGAEFARYCEVGRFAPLLAADWITQTQAAELAGVALSTIVSAVQKNQLRTATDLAEANPQRATRVWRPVVQRRWPRQ